MYNTYPTIRYAGPADAALLADMGRQTFSETFAAGNTPADMAAYLAASFSPNIQAAELADPASCFLIAELDGAAVGYARLYAGAAPAEVGGERPLELVRIYALKEWLGRGVGAALMRACLAEAEKRGHDSLWLGVWEHNPKAQAFYRKWGFVEVGTQIFQLGNDPQRDLIMQRNSNYSGSQGN